jgi:hypothetical protein
VRNSSSAGSSQAGQYAQQGIISALQSLVKDLSNSQVVSGTSGSGLNSSTLSTLNTAFTQLISDLGGNTPASTTAGTATAATGGAAATAGSGTAVSTSTGSTGTAALQSFLSQFLQDLQSNGGTSSGALGGTVNTTA